MTLPGSYANGFAPRDGSPLYPSLWKGCVGAWAPCLGPTGLTLRDWSGRENHGTLTNMTAGNWVASQGRYGLDLDGTNDRFNVDQRAAYPMSISCWFRAASNSRPYHTLYSNDQEISAPRTLIILYLSSGTTYFLSYYTGTYYHSSGFTLNVGEWNHFGITLTSTGAVVMYRNGIQIGSNAGTIAGSVGTSAAWGNSSGLDFIGFGAQGVIDDCIIHDRVLTSSDERLMATRRGIAYELAPRRRSSSAVQFNRRRRLLVGASS